MNSDWYKNVNPNLDKLAGLLGMGNKPSHGYTIAEKAPEVVTAPGVYFPAEKGSVIPLQSRQEGGDVTPDLSKDNDRAKLEMLNQIISMIKPAGLESRAQGGIVVPPEPMKLEQSKYDILKSALSILKPEKAPSEKKVPMESRQLGGDVNPPSGMAEYEANAKKMREEGFGSSIFPKPPTLPIPSTGMANLPTSSTFGIKPESMKGAFGPSRMSEYGRSSTGSDDLYSRLKATSGFPGLDSTSMFSRQKGGEVIPPNPEEDEALKRIQMAMNPSGKVGGSIIPRTPEALELAERQKWANPEYPNVALSTARESLAPGENPANVVGVTPGFDKGYYGVHPEERFIEAAQSAAKPTLDMSQKLIDETRARAQGFGLPLSPKAALASRTQAAAELPQLMAGHEKLVAETSTAPMEALKDITRPQPKGAGGGAPHLVQNEKGEYVWATPGGVLPAGINAPPRTIPDEELVRGKLRMDLKREPTPEEVMKGLVDLKTQKDMGGVPPLEPGAYNVPAITGVKNEEALKGLKPADASVVKGLANYDYPLPGSFALRNPQWKELMGRAKLYDPNFDAKEYNVRYNLRKSFTSGKDKDNLLALNTVTGHIDSLVAAKDALANSNWPVGNKAINVLSQFFPVTEGLVDRQGQVTSIQTKFNAVKGELANVFKRTGATDREIASWEDTIKNPATATPKMWDAFINGSLELMESRISALKDRYESGMGMPKDFTFLSSGSREIFKKLGRDVDKIDPNWRRRQGC